MAISRLTGQDAQSHLSSGGSSVSVSYPGATTAGNLLLAVIVGNANSAAITISGWSTLCSGAQNATSNTMAVLYKLATGSETSIAASFSVSFASQALIDIFEYTGNANPIVLDGTASTANNSGSNVTTYATPSITTTNASDLIFSVIITLSVSGLSWATSSVLGTNTGSGGFEVNCGQYIASGAQSGFFDTATWTTSHYAGTMIGAFKAAIQPPTLTGVTSLTGVSSLTL